MAHRIAGIIALLIGSTAGTLDAQSPDEYHVKAAFLYNFAKFIDWPPNAAASSTDSFTICVLGRDPFGRALDDVISGKAIDGHPFLVRRLSDARQLGGCRILFVNAPERGQFSSNFTDSRQPGLLTVSDSSSTVANGVVINFTMDQGRVRFEINLTAAERENLKVSSRLLSLAAAVKKR